MIQTRVTIFPKKDVITTFLKNVQQKTFRKNAVPKNFPQSSTYYCESIVDLFLSKLDFQKGWNILK
jgi:hypothetical protein